MTDIKRDKKMKKYNIIAVLFLAQFSINLFAKTIVGQSNRIPWGGFWWSTEYAQLAMGWDDEETGRKQWNKKEIKEFNSCLSVKNTTKKCKAMIDELLSNNGRTLSPLMKFDLYTRQLQIKWPTLDNFDPEDSLQTNAAIEELKLKPNDDDAGFAGKCMGWAMSTMFYDEPIWTKEIEGIVFTPGDIKAILATLYTGALFFTDKGAIGTECKGDCNRKAKNDVTPIQLLQGLDLTINQGLMLEADMEPTQGVWNHPIFKYEIDWEFASATKQSIIGSIKLYYANDDKVDMEDVFSVTKTGNKRSLETRINGNYDIISRNLSFTANVEKNWNEDIFSKDIKKSEWIGDSKEHHPDTLVTNLDKDWLELIYEFEGEPIEETQFNFEILKTRAGLNPLVLELLESYYPEKLK